MASMMDIVTDHDIEMEKAYKGNTTPSQISAWPKYVTGEISSALWRRISKEVELRPW